MVMAVVLLGCDGNSPGLHLPRSAKQLWQRHFLITPRVLARGSCTRTRSCTGCTSTFLREVGTQGMYLCGL